MMVNCRRGNIPSSSAAAKRTPETFSGMGAAHLLVPTHPADR